MVSRVRISVRIRVRVGLPVLEYRYGWDGIWTISGQSVSIWTVKFPGDIWTDKIGLVLGLGLGLVMTIQILTVQISTGNRVG